MSAVVTKPTASWAMQKDKDKQVQDLIDTAKSKPVEKWHFNSMQNVSLAPTVGILSTAHCVLKPLKAHCRPSRCSKEKGKAKPSKILQDIAKLVGNL